MERQDIEVIYEDEWFKAINKPTGLVVNRSDTAKSLTLQDYLSDDNGNINPSENSLEFENFTAIATADEETDTLETDFVKRTGIIHRLDKDTSGVILIAKTEDFFTGMQALFKKREVEKTYKAIVYGKFDENEALIDAPIGRNPNIPFKMAIVGEGRASVTHVYRDKVADINGKEYTLLTVKPKTGRTHQIRVHLAATGHPIVQDVIYANKKQISTSYSIFTRLMLHAEFIKFVHPITAQPVEINAKIPEEFLIYF